MILGAWQTGSQKWSMTGLEQSEGRRETRPLPSIPGLRRCRGSELAEWSEDRQNTIYITMPVSNWVPETKSRTQAPVISLGDFLVQFSKCQALSIVLHSSVMSYSVLKRSSRLCKRWLMCSKNSIASVVSKGLEILLVQVIIGCLNLYY